MTSTPANNGTQAKAAKLPAGWIAIECDQAQTGAISMAAEKTFGSRTFRIRRTVKQGGQPENRIFIDCLRVDRAFASKGGAA